jgi:putative chitinase
MPFLHQPYSVDQLIQSDTATARHINNMPPSDIMFNMEKYLILGLNSVKAILGYDLEHSSGYRCPALNAAVGGSKTSAHMEGYAEDFWCPAFGSPAQIVHALAASGLKFDQLIYEHTWVHISFDPRLRQMVETAHFAPGGPTYTTGA